MQRFLDMFRSLSSRDRGIAVFFAGVCFLSIVALGTMFVLRSVRTVPDSGGVFTEGLVGQPIHPNPLLAQGDVDQMIVRLIFSSLADVVDQVELVPDSHGLTYRLRLRQGITWHDGAKLTTDDVLFTIARIQELDTESSLASSWRGVLATRVSEIELEFTLPSPYAFFMNNFRDVYIIPKHLYADVPVANWESSQYTTKPVGSGPYRFSSFERQANGFVTAYDLTVNKSYFASVPRISEFNLRFWANFPDLLKAFNNGLVDAFVSPDPNFTSTIKRPFVLYPFPTGSYYGLFFNQNKAPVFSDTRVRAAIDAAINRGRIVRDVFHERGRISAGPVPFGAFGADEQLSSSDPYSVARARELLDAAGWTLNDQGQREKKDTKGVATRLRFILQIPNVDFLRRSADLIVSDLAAVGIQADVSVLDDAAIDAAIKNRDYDALLFGNALSASSDLFSFWHSSQRFWPGLNISLYSNKKADDLIESLRRGDASAAQSGANFSQLQELIYNDHPAVFLFSAPYLYVASTRLKGVEPSFIAEPGDRFDRVAGWYVRTRISF